MSLASANMTQMTLKAAVRYEIARNDDHRAVQGHSRSLILVPIESPRATSISE